MVMIFLFSLPVVLYAALAVLRMRRDLSHPPAIAFGCLIPIVCVVNAEEIQAFCREIEKLKQKENHLRRERRWKQFRILWGFLREMTFNTRLFQGGIRFEHTKIDPAKSSLDYAPRETLIAELVPEAAEMRMKLYKAQVSFLSRTILGLRVDQKVLISLLGHYKRLEQDIIALAGMSEDRCYRDMLIQNLGLRDWRIFDGGSEPEPA
ncbi:MAG TPA: hypothetical protein VI685_05065 [Candidatus Angelobacter sp.]